MAFECRLCGQQKSLNELLITLQSESQNLKFLNLVEYFCQVKLDPSKSLPQNVCRTCHLSLENFMVFCTKMEAFQQLLKQRTYVKKEESISKSVIVCTTIHNNAKTVVKLEDQPKIDNVATNDFKEQKAAEFFKEKVGSEFPDEDSDSLPDSSDDATSTSSATFHFNLRKKPTPVTKECSVALNKLDIIYEKTDSEYASESSESEIESPPHKRTREMVESPGKRMQLSHLVTNVISKVNSNTKLYHLNRATFI